MDSLLPALTQHGYSILFVLVFLEAIGVPVPAALALLLVGGASGARGPLQPGLALLSAYSAMMLGDTLMFLLGRYTGWWLLGLLCRVSLNPEACILRSADSFYKRGRVILVIAKFLPGINTMAPPLAGSMNLPVLQFLGLDLAGASLYIGIWFGAGYLFSDFLVYISHGYDTVGGIIGWVIAAGFLLWIGHRAWLWLRARKERPVGKVNPAELAARLAADPKIAVFDVRSHGYYEKDTMRIQGSARLEPNALMEEIERLPKDREVVLYCTCIREGTSARVARALEERGIRASIIEGGLRAWKKAGLPVEAVPGNEVVPLPKFS